MIKFIFSSLLTLLYTTGMAQTEKIETDRPDQTECPFTVPRGWVQFETGFNMQRNTASTKEYLHPALLSKYGISHNLELRIITTVQTGITKIPHGNLAKTKGLLPVEVGGKISLWEEKKLLPKTSLIFHTAFPKMASKNYKANKLAPNFRFTMQNTLSSNAALGYNLGAEWDGFTTTPTWVYTFAPGFNLSNRWYAYIEAFGFINKEDAPQHSLDGGIAYLVTDNCKLDISGGFGISKNAPDSYIAVGASIRFKTSK